MKGECALLICVESGARSAERQRSHPALPNDPSVGSHLARERRPEHASHPCFLCAPPTLQRIRIPPTKSLANLFTPLHPQKPALPPTSSANTALFTLQLTLQVTTHTADPRPTSLRLLAESLLRPSGSLSLPLPTSLVGNESSAPATLLSHARL